MPHYVYDDTALFFPKTNLNPLPPGADPTQYVQSVDWNTLNQAVDDIKTQLRGAVWYGFEKQAVDPAPAGIADYLWADLSGDLFFHTGGFDIQLTAGGGTVNSASNVGVGAGSVGIFKQLSGGDLEFKGIRPASTKITVVDAVGTDDVDLDVAEANIVHQNLSGAGTNDHAAIDAQLPTTSQKTDLGQLDGAAQGTVWYSNNVGRVTRLAPGVAGQFLQTAGAAADPVWANPSITVQDETINATNTPHTTLNFTGAGVTATDAGGGVIDITIAGAGAGNSLDAAYTQGQTIDVDLAAVSMTNSLNNSNNVLELTKAPGVGVGGSALLATLDAFATDWTAQFVQNGIGNVSGPIKGIVVSNVATTVTGAGNEEFSPMIALIGKAHDDTNERTWTWGLQNQTVNAVGADESHLHFLVDDQGGGFVSAMSLSDIGDLTIAGKLNVTGLIDPTGMVFDEQVSVPGGTPAAGKATLWWSDTGTLMVTNDSGVDVDLITPTELAVQTQSIDFESGSTQYASVASVPLLNLNGQAGVTIEFWRKPEDLGVNRNVVAKWEQNGNQRAWRVHWNFSNHLNFSTSSDGSASFTASGGGATVPTSGQWDHWAVTRLNSTGNVIMYKNGSSVATPGTFDVGNSPFNGTGDFWIGAAGATGPFDPEDGLLAEVRVWNYERSAGEISANYNKSIDPTTPGLVGYWRLNGDYVDEVNGNDLTPTNSPTATNDVPFGPQTLTSRLFSATGVVDIFDAGTPSIGQVLIATSTTDAAWGTLGLQEAYDAGPTIVFDDTNSVQINKTTAAAAGAVPMLGVNMSDGSITNMVHFQTDQGGATILRLDHSGGAGDALIINAQVGKTSGSLINLIIDNGANAQYGLEIVNNENTTLPIYIDDTPVGTSTQPSIRITRGGAATEPAIEVTETGEGVVLSCPAASSVRGHLAFDGATGDPSTTTQGDLWFNDSAAAFKFYDGTAVVQIASLDQVNQFTKAQYSDVTALTDAATTLINAEDGNLFELTATGGVGATRELDNPTNLAKGMTWVVIFRQDGTGGRALTYDTFYDFGDEGTPDHTTDGANEYSIISCVATATDKIATTVLKGFTG